MNSAGNQNRAVNGREIRDSDALRELSEEYEDVLDWFSDPRVRNEEEKNHKIDPIQVDTLRSKLLERVFDYDFAVEVASRFHSAEYPDSPTLTLSEWAKLLPEEPESLERIHPWQAFAKSEFFQGALWVQLHWYSMNLWHTVPRFDAVEDLRESVFGTLLTKLGGVEIERLKGNPAASSLEERFREVRKVAWRVVVEEVRKGMLANCKPARAEYGGAQAQFDATFATLTESYIEMPELLRDRLGAPKDRLSARQEERAARGSLGVVSRDEISEQRLGRDPAPKKVLPSKELVAGLLWTSPDLPLCLMTPVAAAKAVRRILLSGVNLDFPGLEDEASFTQSFRQLRRDRGLTFFMTHYAAAKRPANIISDFIVGRDDVETGETIPPLRDESPVSAGATGVSPKLPLAEGPLEHIPEDHEDLELDSLPALDWPEGPAEPGKPAHKMARDFKKFSAKVRTRQKERDLAVREARIRLRQPRSPEPNTSASLKLKRAFSVPLIEEFRFRFEFFEEGMISQENPPCR